MSRHVDTVLLADGDLTIEAWTVHRVAAVAPWLEAGHEWKRWDAPYLPAPTQQQRAALVTALTVDPWQRDPRSDRPMRLPVCLDGRAVGTVSWHWEDPVSGWARVGIVLHDPSTWGAGTGTRALRLWASWLHGQPDVHRLDLVTWGGHEAMLTVARRCGFTQEARLVGARLVDGVRQDSVVLAVPGPTV
ncbi:GNAT family N-acetyltransferase [Solicola sp. PLA-1-18]|uniref:GNAT family N-acetyltransferase n=1 Tax=Solicola sp. PLA-1-18 TaxID=3380532 RepID=UPI003B7ECF80